MRNKKLYWISPIIGVACQYLVFFFYAGYDAVFVEHSAGGPVSTDDWLFVNFIYGFIVLPFIGFSYVYLYLTDRFIDRYRIITWCAIGLILGCSIFGWHELFGRYRTDCSEKMLAFIRHLIWVASFFVPVYGITYWYAGRKH